MPLTLVLLAAVALPDAASANRYRSGSHYPIPRSQRVRYSSMWDAVRRDSARSAPRRSMSVSRTRVSELSAGNETTIRGVVERGGLRNGEATLCRAIEIAKKSDAIRVHQRAMDSPLAAARERTRILVEVTPESGQDGSAAGWTRRSRHASDETVNAEQTRERVIAAAQQREVSSARMGRIRDRADEAAEGTSQRTSYLELWISDGVVRAATPISRETYRYYADLADNVRASGEPLYRIAPREAGRNVDQLAVRLSLHRPLLNFSTVRSELANPTRIDQVRQVVRTLNRDARNVEFSPSNADEFRVRVPQDGDRPAFLLTVRNPEEVNGRQVFSISDVRVGNQATRSARGFFRPAELAVVGGTLSGDANATTLRILADSQPVAQESRRNQTVSKVVRFDDAIGRLEGDASGQAELATRAELTYRDTELIRIRLLAPESEGRSE